MKELDLVAKHMSSALNYRFYAAVILHMSEHLHTLLEDKTQVAGNKC